MSGRRLSRGPAWAAILGTVALGACGGSQARQTQRAEGELSDGQIAAVLEVANDLAIQQAQIARQGAAAEEVRSYATTAMAGHRDALQRQEQLLSPRGIDPVASELSQQVQMEGMRVQEQLQGLTGDDLDRAYLQAQLDQQQRWLELLEQRLIPSAQDPAYRAYLERVRDDLSMQLDAARQLEREVMG